MKVFVQIGTNTGKDTFNKMVRNTTPCKVILVEPNADLIDTIYENYKGVENLSVENVAITSLGQGLVRLSRPAHDTRVTKFSNEHFTLVPMDNWGNDLITIKAQSMTFNALCAKHKVNDIHYLEIDTEGYDSEIIKSINFKKINIDIIKYEIWPFDETYFAQYGKDAELYGTTAMRRTKIFLESMGYSCVSDGIDVTAIKLKR